jgi:membrane-associated phospholipid phosphatase
MHVRLTSLFGAAALKARAAGSWPIFVAVVIGAFSFGQGDRSIALALANLPPALVDVAEVLSGVVQPVFLLPACLLLSVAARLRPCDIKLSRFGLFGFNCASVSLVTALLLKHAIGRARPDPDLNLDASLFHPFTLHDAYASFPSAQSASAAAVFISAARFFPHLRYPLHCAALALCCARVLTGEHWVSDVVVGWMIGWLAVFALSPLVLPKDELRK